MNITSRLFLYKPLLRMQIQLFGRAAAGGSLLRHPCLQRVRDGDSWRTPAHGGRPGCRGELTEMLKLEKTGG